MKQKFQTALRIASPSLFSTDMNRAASSLNAKLIPHQAIQEKHGSPGAATNEFNMREEDEEEEFGRVSDTSLIQRESAP